MFPIEAAVKRSEDTPNTDPALQPRYLFPRLNLVTLFMFIVLSRRSRLWGAHTPLYGQQRARAALWAHVQGALAGRARGTESFLSSCNGGEFERRGASWSSAQRRGECAFCALFHHFTQTLSALLIARQFVLFRKVMCAYFRVRDAAQAQ